MIVLQPTVVVLWLLLQSCLVQAAWIRGSFPVTGESEANTWNQSKLDVDLSLHDETQVHRFLGSLTRFGGGLQGETKNLFGASLDLNSFGTVLAAGGPKDGAGQVFLFRYNSKIWTPTTVLIGKRTGDLFGTSVAMSADGVFVAVGARPPQSPGYVQVYAVQSGGNLLLGTLTSGLMAGMDSFGSSLAMAATGFTVAVGAPEAHLKGGYASVFRYNGTRWQPLGPPFVGSYNSTYRLGKSISLSANGDILAIGEPGYANAALGRIRVFSRVGDTWRQMGIDVIGDVAGSRLGQTVSLSANGQRFAATLVRPSGALTRVYQYTASSTRKWEPVGPGGFDTPRVSVKVVSLSAEGTVVATGSTYLGNLTTSNSTSANVYHVSSSGTWTRIEPAIPGGAVVSLSKDGKTVATSLTVGSSAAVRTFQVVV